MIEPREDISRGERRFDGVVCFGGEDWWYHNRGHYDMQMMRELSRSLPVLYVNSIGMRSPRVSEGSMFLRRIRRKLKSLSRGFRLVRRDFAVFSPLAAPKLNDRKIGGRLIARQVERASRAMKIRSPLIWVACPPALTAIDYLSGAGLIYQRTDRYENFPNVDSAKIERCDSELKRRAELTLFCSDTLYESERRSCRDALFVDHGVDYDLFAKAGDAEKVPDDVEGIRRPRIGFVGGIDRHTFDARLFCEVASRLPEFSFVLVGACSLPDDWCTLGNVHQLGQRPYQDVPDYMAACDALIMPWNENDWIAACNPVKLKEYLAVGRPVVSTPFDALRRYSDAVHVASGADAFARALRTAVRSGREPAEIRSSLAEHSWSSKAQQVIRKLAELGLSPRECPE